MVPGFVLVPAVDELSILDSWLGHFNYPEVRVDRFLETIYERLRQRSEAMCLLEEYLEQLRNRYSAWELERIGPAVHDLYRALYYQLMDKKLYRPDGTLQYGYGGRRKNELIILSFGTE
jgi:hypothetical protein